MALPNFIIPHMRRACIHCPGVLIVAKTASCNHHTYIALHVRTVEKLYRNLPPRLRCYIDWAVGFEIRTGCVRDRGPQLRTAVLSLLLNDHSRVWPDFKKAGRWRGTLSWVESYLGCALYNYFFATSVR